MPQHSTKVSWQVETTRLRRRTYTPPLISSFIIISQHEMQQLSLGHPALLGRSRRQLTTHRGCCVGITCRLAFRRRQFDISPHHKTSIKLCTQWRDRATRRRRMATERSSDDAVRQYTRNKFYHGAAHRK